VLSGDAELRLLQRLVKSEEEASSPPIFELSRSFPNWATPVSADGVVYGVEGAVGEKQTP